MKASLLAQGFKPDERHHHYFIYHASDGARTPVKTKTSHGGSKSLGEPLLVQMAKQYGVTKPQFLNLVDCPLDRDDYEQLLRKQKLI